MTRTYPSFRRLIAILATVGLLMSAFPALTSAVGLPGLPSGDGVTPVALAGNHNCTAANADFELRVNAPGEGTFTHAATGFTFTITDVRDTAEGQVFDYTSSGGTIFVIYVKAGPDTNRYTYPAGGNADGADTGLHGTVNPSNGRYYGLSHISICFDTSQGTSASTTLHERTNATGDTDVTPSNNGKVISVLVGAYVNDVVAVTPSAATGTVSFAYYTSLADCEAQTNGTAAGSTAVSGGSATSSTVQFNATGTFWWRAAFDATGLFNDSLSACDEILTVGPRDPSLSTTPRMTPNDSATIGGIFGAMPTGDLVFRLYLNSDCTGDPAYSQTFLDVANGTYLTTNSTVHLTSDATASWTVTYTGDANNASDFSGCLLEQAEVDFDPANP